MLGNNGECQISEKRYGFIYCTTNNINGKKYIGQHKSNPSTDHKYIGSGKFLKPAIKKYGRKNFTREILCWAGNQDELDQMEIMIIRQYNAVDDPSFYNIAQGGNTHAQTQDTRQKISNSLRGIKRSDETIKKMSECKKRENLSDETRMKLSVAAQNRVYGEEWSEKIKACMAKYMESNSYKERQLIIAEKQAEREKEKHVRSQYSKTKPIKIMCIETGEVFCSLHDAGEKTGIDYRNLSAHIHGRVKSLKGLHFVKIDQQEVA